MDLSTQHQFILLFLFIFQPDGSPLRMVARYFLLLLISYDRWQLCSTCLEIVTSDAKLSIKLGDDSDDKKICLRARTERKNFFFGNQQILGKDPFLSSSAGPLH